MAEAIFNALAEDEGISFRAESAGLEAPRGVPMDGRASAALRELGFRGGGTRARGVTGEMLSEARLVLAMEAWHADRLRDLAGGSDRVGIQTLQGHAFGVSGEDIPDPHGRSATAYRAVAYRIFDCVDLLVRRLATEGEQALPAGRVPASSEDR
jgi:protein-tyrosine-phosphatase